MANNSILRFGSWMAMFLSLCTMQIRAQDFINTRKIALFRGDTSVVAGILADVRIDKVDPQVFYYWYGHNQIHANQGGYSGHLLHGEYLEYGPSGNMLLKGTYAKGVRSGHWIYWYEGGAIKETREYEDGMLEGENIKYTKEGRIIHLALYRRNLLHGETTTILSDTLYQIKYNKGKEKKRKPMHVFGE